MLGLVVYGMVLQWVSEVWENVVTERVVLWSGQESVT